MQKERQRERERRDKASTRFSQFLQTRVQTVPALNARGLSPSEKNKQMTRVGERWVDDTTNSELQIRDWNPGHTASN